MCRKNIDKKVIGEAKHPDKSWRVRTVFHAWSLDLPSTELLMLSRDISVCSRGSEAFCELSENRSATFFESYLADDAFASLLDTFAVNPLLNNI
jgi:hypothetical protein